MDTPQYGSDHEEGCTFLGRYSMKTQYREFDYDLWWGPDACGPTVIARWSRSGPDYSSGMCFGWLEDQPDHPLVEARKRAEALGLDVQRETYAGKMKRHPSGMYYTAGSEAQVNELYGEDQP